jgi:hypothetical protein
LNLDSAVEVETKLVRGKLSVAIQAQPEADPPLA